MRSIIHAFLIRAPHSEVPAAPSEGAPEKRRRATEELDARTDSGEEDQIDEMLQGLAHPASDDVPPREGPTVNDPPNSALGLSAWERMEPEADSRPGPAEAEGSQAGRRRDLGRGMESPPIPAPRIHQSEFARRMSGLEQTVGSLVDILADVARSLREMRGLTVVPDDEPI